MAYLDYILFSSQVHPGGGPRLHINPRGLRGDNGNYPSYADATSIKSAIERFIDAGNYGATRDLIIYVYPGHYRINADAYATDDIGSRPAIILDGRNGVRYRKVYYWGVGNLPVIDLVPDDGDTIGDTSPRSFNSEGYIYSTPNNLNIPQTVFANLIYKNVNGILWDYTGRFAPNQAKTWDSNSSIFIGTKNTTGSGGIGLRVIVSSVFINLPEYYDINNKPFGYYSVGRSALPYRKLDRNLFLNSSIGFTPAGNAVDLNTERALLLGGVYLDKFKYNYFDANSKVQIVDQRGPGGVGDAFDGNVQDLDTNWIHEDARIDIYDIDESTTPNTITGQYSGPVSGVNLNNYSFGPYFQIVNDADVDEIRKGYYGLVVGKDSIWANLPEDKRPAKIFVEPLIIDFNDSNLNEYSPDQAQVDSGFNVTSGTTTTETDSTLGVDSTGTNALNFNEAVFEKEIDLGFIREFRYADIDWGLAFNEFQNEEYGVSGKTARNRNIPIINQGESRDTFQNAGYEEGTTQIFAFEIAHKLKDSDSYSAYEPYLYHWPTKKYTDGNTTRPSGQFYYNNPSDPLTDPSNPSDTFTPIDQDNEKNARVPVYARYIKIRITVHSNLKHV